MSFPAPRAIHRWKAGRFELALGKRTHVVGILNCTPDSFSDGGAFLSPSAARARFDAMVEEGADLIDVGGESTRPGASPVELEEEWRRVEPILRAAGRGDTPISIDTRKAVIARRALELGAAVVNDVSALRDDSAMASVVASHEAGLILMHMRGAPDTMQHEPRYDDVASEVRDFLRAAASRARGAGVASERIVLDPGIGFGKTVGQNLALLRAADLLAKLGYPVLVGASRKRFLGNLLDLGVDQRLEASLAAHVAAVLAGAHLVRVHDVAATVRAVRIADALFDLDPSEADAERLRRTREVG